MRSILIIMGVAIFSATSIFSLVKP